MQRVIKKILLDVALVAFILVELLLAALLCSLLPISIGIPLFLVTPFSIGAVSYFIFQRVTPKQRIREEAEDWLAKRARGLMPYRAKSRTGKRVAIWIPTIVVTVLLLFFPETFGILLHVMYPTSGKLLRYRVSFPATWMVGDTSMNESHTWAFAGAFECKGPFRAGLTRYTHGNPPASAMEFWDSPGGDPATRQPPSGTLFSTRTFPLGKDSITCREYIPTYLHWQGNEDVRLIECSTPRRDFFASFGGDWSAVPYFYRTLGGIRATYR
jgi:hypothetical protein